MTDAAQTQRDRDLARHHPDDRDRDRVGSDLPAVLDEEVVVLPLADVDAASPAADDDAGSRLADPQARVGPRLARRDHRDERRARIPFGIGAIARVPDIVALDRLHVLDADSRHRRRHLAGEPGSVELGDRARAAAAAADVIPESLPSHPKRRDDANARDNDGGIPRMTHGWTIVSGYLVISLSGNRESYGHWESPIARLNDELFESR